MSLRVRLTAAVAVMFALVVIGSVYAAHVSASRQLRSATDQFLTQRAERFTRARPSDLPNGPPEGGGFVFGGRGPAFADPDALTQLLTNDGTVRASITGQPTLPINASDRTIAEHGGKSTIRNVDV